MSHCAKSIREKRRLRKKEKHLSNFIRIKYANTPFPKYVILAIEPRLRVCEIGYRLNHENDVISKMTYAVVSGRVFSAYQDFWASHSIRLMLKDFVEGNFQRICFIHLLRTNQEQCKKCNDRPSGLNL